MGSIANGIRVHRHQLQIHLCRRSSSFFRIFLRLINCIVQNHLKQPKPFRVGGGAPLCVVGKLLPQHEIHVFLKLSQIGTTSNIYTHLSYSSKVSSAQAILGILPS